RDHVTVVRAAEIGEPVELEVRVRVRERRLKTVERLRDERELEPIAARASRVLVVNPSGLAGQRERDQLVVDVDREQREVVAVPVPDQAADTDLEVLGFLRLEQRIEPAAAARVRELRRRR